MARSNGIIKVEVWEAGSEFRQLSLAAQWCYTMLISQPQINNCGVLFYRPDRWARLAINTTPEIVHWSLDELAQHRYIVVDTDTDELLVRTFIKHDRIWKQPNLITAARREFRTIESGRIRSVLLTNHPWLVDNRPAEAVKDHENRPPTKPLTEGVNEGVTQEGVSEPLNVRATQAHAPVPSPFPNPSPLPQGSDVELEAKVSGFKNQELPIELELLILECQVAPTSDEATAIRTAGTGVSEQAVVRAREAVRKPGIRNRVGRAIATLKSVELERTQGATT